MALSTSLGPFTVRTNFTPPITIDPAAKSTGSALLKLIQPTVDGQVLGQPIHYAPWGDASAGAGSFLVFALAGLAALGAWTIVRRVLH